MVSKSFYNSVKWRNSKHSYLQNVYPHIYSKEKAKEKCTFSWTPFYIKLYCSAAFYPFSLRGSELSIAGIETQELLSVDTGL